MRCTVVHCTLTACLQGEFWRNGTKVLCSCSCSCSEEKPFERLLGQYCTLTFSMRRISSQQRSLEIHFVRWLVHLPQSIAKFLLSFPALNKSNTSESYSHKPNKCYSESVYKGFRGDDSVPLTIHTTHWRNFDMWMTFAYINRPADSVRGHETEISVGNTQMFVLKSKNRPVVLDFEAVVTNPSSQPNSL